MSKNWKKKGNGWVRAQDNTCVWTNEMMEVKKDYIKLWEEAYAAQQAAGAAQQAAAAAAAAAAAL